MLTPRSKRKGLEKALHQIEQAIKRPKSDGTGSDAAQRIISNLQELLNKTQQGQSQQLQSETDELSEGPEQSNSFPSPRDINAGDNLSLDDAENPLQLLARASDLQLSPAETRETSRWHPSTSVQPTALPRSSLNGNEPSAKSFFVPVRASLDVGPDMDPIDVGLVTSNEAESLFSLYVYLQAPANMLI